MSRVKVKFFLVSIIFALFVGASNVSAMSKYGITTLDTRYEPESLMIPDTLFPELGLSPGFHNAFRMIPPPWGSPEDIKIGFVMMVGGVREVTITGLVNTLKDPPIFEYAGLVGYNEGYPYDLVSSSGLDSASATDYVNSIDLSFNGYYFSGYFGIGFSGLNPPDAEYWIVPNGADSFFGVLDLHTSEPHQWMFRVDVGDIFDENMSPIPEPETYTMLLAGLGLIGFSLRRRAAVTPRDDPGRFYA